MKPGKIISLLLCFTMILAIQIPVFANENSENFCDNEHIQVIQIDTVEMENILNDSAFVETIDLGNGFKCSVFEEQTTSLYAAGTITKTHDFALSCDGNYFGYLRQTTSWSYDGANRPTLLSDSNTFYSVDTSTHYLTGRGSSTTAYGTSSSKYTRTADVYYNSKYIATTDFSTICDKNGNLSYACTDV